VVVETRTPLFAFHSPADRMLGALPSPALNNRARSFFWTNGFTAFPRRAGSRSRVVKPCASHADGLALVNIHSSTEQITMTLQPVCTLIVFPGITNNLYGDPTCIKFCRQQPCLASSPFRSPLLLSAAINPQRRTKVQRLRALLRTRRRTQPPGKKLPIRAA
jgi:hypothetical protein